ncbi:RNA degradosome polyphosphate kinase [Caldisalinibacter kiritimatiensis]|uniref:Polyphosphate kinase n=1 Tax=Caldisalinibacter kiritimatiensis TaxID=1304284 RepID=R1AW23_9FIRM|nr:RNA degradosome polyphosphate kinase [Caldisalinibacter kiritimatiensis]EOD01378.1 Polyphosphate kinase [Caldisalinibacter kiritimatiensis]
MNNVNFDDAKYFFNRELSWLEFNDRVLEEAIDENNPLFEKLKFIAITSSNLDEFFMVRVASLKDQVTAEYDKKDPAGLTPKMQLKRISQRVHKMVEDQYCILNENLIPELKNNGINFVYTNDLSEKDKEYLENYFTNIVYPVLTPMAVDPSRPFPLILNKTLNIGVLLKGENEDNDLVFATVQVPSVLPRIVEVPTIENGHKNYIFLEEVIDMYIERLFLGKEIICSYPYRITRNADLTIHEEEAEDLLIEIEKSLKRRRWGEAIRLEVSADMDERLVNILQNSLEIHKGEIYKINGPIDLTFIFKLISDDGYRHLKFNKYTPQIPKDLLGEEHIFEAISKKDIFLHHPYESFDPVVNFVQKAAKDPNVLAIKQTLYRVSGDSPIVKALAEAADKGKQVTVLVEIKARFDEENNIIWAKRLEKAGCHVIYGLLGLKTHSKITLVVRKEGHKIKRYVHLGTGNYNDITAKLYTDMGLFTCNEYFGSDASVVFNMLSGYSEPPELYKLNVAPLNLREKFIDLINNEIENARSGKKAKIIAKMNALVDPGIIKALYKASSAGVEIELIVRGICCLRPGIPGVSENITVRSIVGRFLEHSRIYYFYNDGREELFLSSADWMPRNLNRRVELLFPIEDLNVKRTIISSLKIMLNDTSKARILQSDGYYIRADKMGKFNLNSQEFFCKLAMQEVENYNEDKMDFIFKPIKK